MKNGQHNQMPFNFQRKAAKKTFLRGCLNNIAAENKSRPITAGPETSKQIMRKMPHPDWK